MKQLYLALMGLLLAGCANYDRVPYGEIDPDKESLFDDGRGVVMPANAPTISQGFDPLPKIKATREPPADHLGIDIVGNVGTPVLAASNGTVTTAFFEPMFGNQMAIQHGRGDDNRIIKTNYYHLDTMLVEEGDTIVRGQQLGTLGSSGLFAAQPHLHFEVRAGSYWDGWEPQNPHKYWYAGPGIVTCYDASENYPSTEIVTTYPVPCLGIPWQ